MSEPSSIFDSNLDPSSVTRRNGRRKAVMIPLKQGKELAEMVKKEIEKEDHNVKETKNHDFGNA